MPTLQVRVSEEELLQIKEAAQGNVSDYVRSAAISRVKGEVMLQALKELGDNIDLHFSTLTEKICAEPAANMMKAPELLPHDMGRGLRAMPTKKITGPVSNEVFRRAQFEGWWVVKAPDGSSDGYWSEHHDSVVKVITNGKREEVLRKDDPLYAEY